MTSTTLHPNTVRISSDAITAPKRSDWTREHAPSKREQRDFEKDMDRIILLDKRSLFVELRAKYNIQEPDKARYTRHNKEL